MVRSKKEIIGEFIAVSERPDYPDSNLSLFLEVLCDIRDALVESNDAWFKMSQGKEHGEKDEVARDGQQAG